MIEIKFIFETMEEAMEFLNSKKEQQTKPKKENDGRGKSTKMFHMKAKLYRTEHPNKTYKECLQDLSNLNKNKGEIE
jgi:chromatin segregation and condensation protein Rec8/ScpA/Scc1 (kleisin family)